MKIVVDRMQCEANGICEGIAPDVFRLDDDDELHILIAEINAEQLSDIEDAVYQCPKQALSIERG